MHPRFNSVDNCAAMIRPLRESLLPKFQLITNLLPCECWRARRNTTIVGYGFKAAGELDQRGLAPGLAENFQTNWESFEGKSHRYDKCWKTRSRTQLIGRVLPSAGTRAKMLSPYKRSPPVSHTVTNRSPKRMDSRRTQACRSVRMIARRWNAFVGIWFAWPYPTNVLS